MVVMGGEKLLTSDCFWPKAAGKARSKTPNVHPENNRISSPAIGVDQPSYESGEGDDHYNGT